MVYNRHSFIYLIFETKLVPPKLALNLHSPCLGYKSAGIIDVPSFLAQSFILQRKKKRQCKWKRQDSHGSCYNLE